MNWKIYKNSLDKLSNKEKGDSFEKLVKIYLKQNYKFRNILSKVWLLDEVPIIIKNKLNLPLRDEGIDLICETNKGEFWAVQAKYRTNELSSISHHDLETFGSLTFGHCRNIKHALVCTSANRYAKLFTTYPNLSFLSGEVWRCLDSQYFDVLKDSRKKVKLKPYKPFFHQKEAIEKAFNHFVVEKNRRGKLIMACGTGKSHTAYWVANKIKADKILVAVPSISLIKQTMDDWLREIVANKQDFEFHIVCSDHTTTNIDNDELKTNLQDIEIPVDTNTNKISTWLKERNKKKVVVLTTYQSGKKISEAAKKINFSFDLGIFDEAHKTVGSKNKNSAHLLFDENINIKKRMFMTATQKFYKGSSDKIVSMNFNEMYGETFHSLSFRRAIELSKNLKRPILTDYKIYPLAVSAKEISQLINKNCYVKPKNGPWNDDTQSRFLVSLVALNKAVKKFGINHAISFHSSLSKAEAFQKSQELFIKKYVKYAKTQNFFISGKYTSSERNRILEDYGSSDLALITNARCLTEGVDVPNIDCVLFVDPKSSKIDIVQALGRALRYHKGKKLGYVILPIVINHIDDTRNDSAFQNIMMTIRQLASNDSRIIEYFKAIKRGKRVEGDNPVVIDKDFLSYDIDADKFIENIHLKGFESTARLSWMPFDEARGYVQALELKTHIQWIDYCASGDKPIDIPVDPVKVYAHEGWDGYGDWLGTYRIANRNRNYKPFKKARAFVHKLNLKSRNKWNEYSKSGERPIDIPGNPNKVYRDEGWVNTKDWLGIKKK